MTETDDSFRAESVGSHPWSDGSRAESDESESGSDESRIGFFLDPGNWPLFYHTATNMHVRQLAGVAERKARHLVVPSLPVDFDERYERRIPPDLRTTPAPIRANTATLRRCVSAEQRRHHLDRARAVREGNLTLLNETLHVAPGGEPNWFHPALADQPELWAIKFRGFEFLADVVFGTETPADVADEHDRFRRWIRSWARSDETKIGTHGYLRRAWTPHAVSLRLLNWCRYYCWCVDTEAESAFLDTLARLIYKNALFLEQHIERDIGGNHLIENGIALVMAGVLFRTHDAGARWLETGVAVLDTASDQFLPDGGHFEHSPMYHVIALTRYLTALGLLAESGSALPSAVADAATRGTRFLQAIRPPDGRIPLLNDAVYGQALELDDCLAYAEAVGVEPQADGDIGALPESGYYWLGDGGDRLLVDGGRFGPPSLPAHSHNDLFSVLLWVDGTQLVTDTGTYDYAPTARRQYARSVRGHNTVQVGPVEPVDIGGRYLAGKRLQPQVQYTHADGHTVFDGAYRKHSLSHGYRHRRQVVTDGEWWLIRDSVTDTERDAARSHLHFHPQVRVERQDAGDGFALAVDGTELAYLLPVGFTDVTRGTSPYFPEFRREIRRPSLKFVFSPGRDPVDLLISKRPCSRSEYREYEARANSLGQ
ncbi:heparinase II/III family protein [Halovenus marina]|uniref:heparinase II/III family protein n=1 Tax=Halovenus marina TaxID=3396621 RepID=UPI003F54FBCF